MRIAIPVVGGRLSAHFGHCETFAFLDVDLQSRVVTKRAEVPSPPHQPGLLPGWLAEQGADVILAGGMGPRALALMAERGIRVVVGVPAETPDRLVSDFLAGTLEEGRNVCDH